MTSHFEHLFYIAPLQGLATITGLHLTPVQAKGSVGKSILEGAGRGLNGLPGGNSFLLLDRLLRCRTFTVFNHDDSNAEEDRYHMVVPHYEADEGFDEPKRLKFIEEATKVCGTELKWVTMRDIDLDDCIGWK